MNSVAICILSSLRNWHLKLDDSKCTGLVFIDITKAFDTVEQDIQAEKSASVVGSTDLKWL